MSKKLENDRQDQDCKSDCSSCGNISAEDIEIPSWALQRFQEDASWLVERLEKNHELKYLEPPEELFQKILGETREKGLLREETQKQKKRNKKEENSRPSAPHPGKRKYLGWAAAAAITCIGIFGVSMSTKADRSYLMEKITGATGDKTKITAEGNEEVLISDTTEEEVRYELENILQAKLPIFLYLPDGMGLVSYTLDEDAQTVYMKYEYQGKYLYSVVHANYKDNRGIYRNDKGENLGMISGELADIAAELWKIQEESDIEPAYLAQWDYKNSYYRIWGKVSEQEMEDIVKNIMY